MLEDPFPDLQIADSSFLDSTESRYKCERCTKSRKFFCYTCCTPNPRLQEKLPKVKLPIKIDIIKHQSESDGKSTCPHAVVLAPDDVTVYTFPCIPDYDKEKVVLVFPCKEASTLRELSATHGGSRIATSCKGASDTENAPPTIGVPDSCHDDKISAELQRIELRDHETQFWRCHEGLATSCLSTIEAIYYFMREYHEDVLGSTYSNEYDNLLFFFVYLYHTIRQHQHGGKGLKAYQRKLKDQ